MKVNFILPAPNFEWEHDMSPPNSEFMNMDSKILEKISVVPQPVQKPHPPLWQVVDSPSSIEWAAKMILLLLCGYHRFNH